MARQQEMTLRVDPAADWSPPEKLIIIATFYRTGSNHLCDLMTSTKRLGTPREYLFPRGPLMQLAMQEKSFDAQRFFANVAAEWQTENGVAAIKLFPSHMSRLLDAISLDRWFPDIRFIWLQRADTLGQAVSLALAGNNDDWFEHQPDNNSGRKAQSVPRSVDFALKGICGSHAFWAEFFARNDITPLLVSYEELVSRPRQIVSDIAQFCDIELPSGVRMESKFTRTPHQQNRSLRDAFLAQQDRFGPLQPPSADIFPRTMSNLVRFIKHKELRKRRK